MVLPPPAGAWTTTTPPGSAADRRPNRARRRTSPRPAGGRRQAAPSGLAIARGIARASGLRVTVTGLSRTPFDVPEFAAASPPPLPNRCHAVRGGCHREGSHARWRRRRPAARCGLTGSERVREWPVREAALAPHGRYAGNPAARAARGPAWWTSGRRERRQARWRSSRCLRCATAGSWRWTS